jgi:hypothetical protein
MKKIHQCRFARRFRNLQRHTLESQVLENAWEMDWVAVHKQVALLIHFRGERVADGAVCGCQELDQKVRSDRGGGVLDKPGGGTKI